MIEALIFDAEGVVLDSEPAWDEAQREFLRRRGHRYDRDRIKPLLSGRSLAEGTSILKREYGLSGEPAELARERLEIVARLLARRLPFVPGFQAFLERVRPVPGGAGVARPGRRAAAARRPPSRALRPRRVPGRARARGAGGRRRPILAREGAGMQLKHARDVAAE